ncbi:MAG TPA: hypothetical protein VGI70_17835, partial [Polyangiales bacterium]
MTPIRQAAKHPTVASPARHAAFALLACALSLSSLIARAQPVATPPAAATESDQRARSLFERGRQAYGDGRYRDAWAYFHDSYELSGRPELLYNIGQTADRLGQDADALRAFRMYLQKLPQAPNRHDVENRIHALEDRVSANAQSAPEAAP